MKRLINFSDSAAIALLHLHQANCCDMISLDMALEYDEIINKNLFNIIGGETNKKYDEYKDMFLYIPVNNDNNEICLVINPVVDIKEARKKYIDSLSPEVLLASVQDNALDVLKLAIKDGKLTNNKIISLKK